MMSRWGKVFLLKVVLYLVEWMGTKIALHGIHLLATKQKCCYVKKRIDRNWCSWWIRVDYYLYIIIEKKKRNEFQTHSHPLLASLCTRVREFVN